MNDTCKCVGLTKDQWPQVEPHQVPRIAEVLCLEWPAGLWLLRHAAIQPAGSPSIAWAEPLNLWGVPGSIHRMLVTDRWYNNLGNPSESGWKPCYRLCLGGDSCLEMCKKGTIYGTLTQSYTVYRCLFFIISNLALVAKSPQPDCCPRIYLKVSRTATRWMMSQWFR